MGKVAEKGDSKSLLRKRYLNTRANVNLADKNLFDRRIMDNITNSDLYKNSSIILGYYPIRHEIDILKLIGYSLEIGKAVALPVCGDILLREMSFYKINDITRLKMSSYGILEPDKDASEKITDFSTAFCIVPAISYDVYGYRIGYGGGYYDKFLSENSEVCSVGICYEACLTDMLPREEHDINVKYIVTENRFTEVYDARQGFDGE